MNIFRESNVATKALISYKGSLIQHVSETDNIRNWPDRVDYLKQLGAHAVMC